jgi:hypothetical protein
MVDKNPLMAQLIAKKPAKKGIQADKLFFQGA